MRRLLFVINSTFPRYSGGRETWLSHVLHELADRGRVADVATLAPHGRPPAGEPRPVPPGTRILTAANPFDHPLAGRLLRGPLGAIRLPLHAWALRAAVGRWLADSPDPADIVLLDTVVTPWAVRPFLNRAMVYCASKGPHAEVLAARFPWLRTPLLRLELRAYRESAAIWANGEDMRQYIAAQGFPSITIGNGVDLDGGARSWPRPAEYGDPRTDWSIVTVGTLLPIKGIGRAVEALAHTSATLAGRRIHLYCVGKGDPTQFRALAAALGVADRVHFVGERANVFPYLQHADLGLALSGGGGLSMALLESLAAGVPMIAWDTPVYRQILHDGRNALLVPDQDASALGAAIARAVTLQPDELRALGLEGRRAAAHHSWEAVTDRLLSALGAR